MEHRLMWVTMIMAPAQDARICESIEQGFWRTTATHCDINHGSIDNIWMAEGQQEASSEL